MSTPTSTASVTVSAAASAPNPRLARLLSAPVGRTLARLAAPNIVVAMALASVMFADAYFLARVDLLALAAVAIVFPVQALMSMMSAGAMGGGVSSAVARALGSGQAARAEAVATHAVGIAICMAALYTLLGAVLAPQVFGLLGARGPVLDAAVAYGEVAFGGAIAMWLANTFASVLRGSGNMAAPAVIMTIAALGQIALSGALTLGWGPFPALGVRGPAAAMVIGFAAAALAMGGLLARGQGGARLRLIGVRFSAGILHDIVKVGALACGNALLTVATVLIVTRLVAAEGVAALAGYGLGSRLELMLVPLTFGVGGALTAMVGTNIGARQHARARRIAWTGGLAVFAATGALGLVVAIQPDLWLMWFDAGPQAYAEGERYLRIVGPFYGFFGLGMALYFASQGTGNMTWSLAAGLARLLVAAGGGYVASRLMGLGPESLFVAVAVGLVVFGGGLAWSLTRKAWHA